MQITYQSDRYSPEAVTARYVGIDTDGLYRFCEVNAKRRDIRQGIVDVAEVPEAVRIEAEKRRGFIPYQVTWPL